MYVPNMFRETDVDEMFAFMQQNAFATVISVAEEVPVATHLPLSVSRVGDQITLRGHFAKANPHWQELGKSEALVIFNGPHAYVSAKHYDRTDTVPTWNYLAVHVRGRPRLVDADGALGGLHELIDSNDPAYRSQWDSLSDRYREGMLKGIVGFEMNVLQLEGKKKLSQNKSRQERERIAAYLAASDDSTVRSTGHEMSRLLPEESDSD